MARKRPVDPAMGVELSLEQATPDFRPLIDAIISKVRSIDSVGHMYYVRKYKDEALDLLQQLRNSV